MQHNRGMLGMLAVALLAACVLGCADEKPKSKIVWKKSTALPEDFPKDVPIYPNAKLDSAVWGKGMPSEDGAFLAWKTQDEIQVVRHFLTEKLDAEGWHVISYPGVPAAWMGEGGVTVVATKWGRTASFAVAAKDNATLISLVFPGKG